MGVRSGLMASLLAGWLMVNDGHNFGIETGTEKDQCYEKDLTLWACFFTTESGYPETTNGPLTEVFMDTRWNPRTRPIPSDWLRSLKKDDGTETVRPARPAGVSVMGIVP